MMSAARARDSPSIAGFAARWRTRRARAVRTRRPGCRAGTGDRAAGPRAGPARASRRRSRGPDTAGEPAPQVVEVLVVRRSRPSEPGRTCAEARRRENSSAISPSRPKAPVGGLVRRVGCRPPARRPRTSCRTRTRRSKSHTHAAARVPPGRRDAMQLGRGRPADRTTKCRTSWASAVVERAVRRPAAPPPGRLSHVDAGICVPGTPPRRARRDRRRRPGRRRGAA